MVHQRCGPRPRWVAHLPCVTSRFVPGIFIFHGSVYLTYRELFVGAAQDGTSEDNGERVRWSAIGIPKAVQARRAVRMLLMLCSGNRMRAPSHPKYQTWELTGNFWFSVVIRIGGGGGLAVDFAPSRDNRSMSTTETGSAIGGTGVGHWRGR